MYADKITDSMQRTIDETERRRAKQIQYNEKNGIIPTQIVKKSSARDLITLYSGEEEVASKDASSKQTSQKRPSKIRTSSASSPKPYIEEDHKIGMVADPVIEYMNPEQLKIRIDKINAEMIAAAKRLILLRQLDFATSFLPSRKYMRLKRGGGIMTTDYKLFLPTSKDEMERLGWDCPDVILFSGDAYVDHPSLERLS